MAKSPSFSVVNVTVPTPPLSPSVTSPRTISELISHQAAQLPNEPILGYPSQGIQYEEYTFFQLESFSTQAAAIYSQALSPRQNSQEAERVVALLGASDLDYFITALALSRLGFTVLFLSTRISEAAYISLLNVTKCGAIVVGSSFRRTVSSIKSTLPDLQVVSILTSAQYSSTSPHPSEQVKQPEFNLNDETHRICWIIHSSGSTGLPKPIYQTHQAALHNYENNMNMQGFITLPLFHAHGLSSVFRAIQSVKMIYMYSASLPLTKQNLLDIMKQHQNKFEIFYGVPYALKLLSESEVGIQSLAAMKMVMFGGSACPDTLGDKLVGGGVNLVSHYGTTETGQLMTSSRPIDDKVWNYVRVHKKLEPFVLFEERGGNLFELVVLEGWPSLVATNRPGGYATKDLFEPHPTILGAWKYSGRLDDTIVLINGEKAIPIAMEQAVRQNALVREAVVFGAGKSRLGMMIIPSESTSSIPAANLLDAVWPAIEKENAGSPSYAQLAPEMISILPTATPYPQTDKGTVIRQGFYRTFQQQIEDVYQRLEASSSGGTLILPEKEMRNFLRTEIIKFMPNEDEEVLHDDTDLFSLGIDSLQSTRLRGVILQQLQFNGHAVPQNVVFENPTIAKLSDELIRIRDSKVGQARNVIKEMEDLVAKFGVFPQHVPVPTSSMSTCVVLTGASGSLGAHVAAQLASREDIDEVCCLVRASSNESARRRVIRSMQERAVYHSLSLQARRKITCFKSNISENKLGLTREVYDCLCQKTTTLIHCAWSVNFNKSLSSFEDCISGAHNLIELCLMVQRPRPASFNFCSSVSTVAATPGENVPEALPESFACAQGMGYAQSKLVTENLVARAAVETGMQARVLRVGQIVADTKHGIWNDTEAIPLMLQAATTIKALPTLDESPRWLPVDTVGTTVMDISLSSTTQTVLNVVNPKTFHWTRDLIPCLRSAGLTFEEVSQRDWVRRLRASNPDPVLNPTIKLLEFFGTKYDNDVVKRKSLGYTTTAAESLSPALASTPQLTQELVTKFVRHFLRTSWASPTKPLTSLCGPRTRVIVLAGPCGSGKSVVASGLADGLGCATIEGDSVHDSIAITKMSSGVPLSSLDREIWLTRLKTAVLERIRAAQLLRRKSLVVDADAEATIIVTCSALRREHRDALRNMLSDQSIRTQFVVLQAGEEELIRRVSGRKGHYMKASMVASQIAAIEQPMIDETDVLPVDAEEGSVKEIVDLIASLLEP